MIASREWLAVGAMALHDEKLARWLAGKDDSDGVEVWIGCVEDKTRAELLDVIWEMMTEIDRLKVAAGETEAPEAT